MTPEATPRFSYEPNSEKIVESESRFGDKEKILRVMESGRVVDCGLIEEVYPDRIAPHANEVRVVDVQEVSSHVNKAMTVDLEGEGGEKIRCVFKPLSGESSAVKAEISRDTGCAPESIYPFYTMERLAYTVSEHFGFDVVPPTVIREIEGEVGSLQFFLEDYVTFTRAQEVLVTPSVTRPLWTRGSMRLITLQ